MRLHLILGTAVRKNAAAIAATRLEVCLMKCQTLLAAAVLLGATVAADASPYLVTMQQVGSNVVATGSGDIDPTGLTAGTFQTFSGAQIGGSDGGNPEAVVIVASGGVNQIFGAPGSISGPTSLTPFFTLADSSSGDAVGLLTGPSTDGLNDVLEAPIGYMPDTLLNSTSTYDNTTLANLGVTPGTYEWTWGSGVDQSFTLDIVAPSAVPLPAALPLFATGLGVIGLFGWRRKRKNTAAVAA